MTQRAFGDLPGFLSNSLRIRPPRLTLDFHDLGPLYNLHDLSLDALLVEISLSSSPPWGDTSQLGSPVAVRSSCSDGQVSPVVSTALIDGQPIELSLHSRYTSGSAGCTIWDARFPQEMPRGEVRKHRLKHYDVILHGAFLATVLGPMDPVLAPTCSLRLCISPLRLPWSCRNHFPSEPIKLPASALRKTVGLVLFHDKYLSCFRVLWKKL